MTVRKAVVPAAGRGTRLLPATKSVPKAMLPVVDRPVLHYVLEEAFGAGLADVLLITGRGKRAIEQYCDRAPELARALEATGDAERRTRSIDVVPDGCTVHYVRQREPRGLGDAVLQARAHVGGDSFCVLLGDSIVEPDASAELRRLVDVHEETGAAVVALEAVPSEETTRRGIVDVAGSGADPVPGDPLRIEGFVEKPEPSDAPSRLSVAARYVLTPAIFGLLRRVEPGIDGEIQLTDALDVLARSEPVYGVPIAGRRHDVGNLADYARTFLSFALEDERTAEAVREALRVRGWSEGASPPSRGAVPACLKSTSDHVDRQRSHPERRHEMSESVYKRVELVGTSEKSWEDAARKAVERASESLRDLRVAEVEALDMQMKDGKVETYRARVKVSFKYED